MSSALQRTDRYGSAHACKPSSPPPRPCVCVWLCGCVGVQGFSWRRWRLPATVVSRLNPCSWYAMLGGLASVHIRPFFCILLHPSGGRRCQCPNIQNPRNDQGSRWCVSSSHPDCHCASPSVSIAYSQNSLSLSFSFFFTLHTRNPGGLHFHPTTRDPVVRRKYSFSRVISGTVSDFIFSGTTEMHDFKPMSLILSLSAWFIHVPWSCHMIAHIFPRRCGAVKCNCSAFHRCNRESPCRQLIPCALRWPKISRRHDA